MIPLKRYQKLLGIEISLALMAKLIAIGLIWYVCFSGPVINTKDPKAIEHHLLEK